jgi:hypothetical protein
VRHLTIAFSIAALATTPAIAAPPPVASPSIPTADIQRALNDPAVADQLGRVAGVMTKSLMNLPVGEIEAAMEGRPATAQDRARTVRDSVGDPYLEQRIAAEAAQSGRTMQAAGRAFAASLPAIMGALGQVQDAVERSVANIPDPTYPRR